MDSGRLIRKLKEAGWRHVRTRGSHHQFKHADHPKLITVPHPAKDLGKGLVKKIFKEAGLTRTRN